MNSIPGFLVRPFQRNSCRTAVVSEAHDINGQFRFIGLLGESLQEEAWNRGQKVRFRVGDALFRTHIPAVWDMRRGFAGFIFFLHGQGPGSTWAAALKKGDICLLSPPQTCLDFQGMKGPTIFFGDESSIGSARALAASAYAEQEHRYVFEVASPSCAEQVFRHARLFNATAVGKTAGGGHLSAVMRVLLDAARGASLPKWVFTGCAQSIQKLREQFRLQGVPWQNINVRPYWAEGKTALD